MAPVFYTEHNKEKWSVILITEGRKSHRFVIRTARKTPCFNYGI